MFVYMSRVWCVLAGTSVLVACAHTEPTALQDHPPVGPFTDGSPVRLTFSGGDDRFANWTDDGNGILYSYQVPNRLDRDRCLGVLPAEGGARQFELCEHRVAFSDSTDFIASGALATVGRLLYLQATSRTNAQLLGVTRLYLADTTSLSASRLLLTLPINLGTTFTNWLVNMHWTGADTFIGLAQQFTVAPVGAGAARDTTFVSVAVVRGTITAQGAVLSPIAGTSGASSYSRVESGAALLISRGGQTLERVPIEGGVPTTVIDTLLVPGTGGGRIVSHSCRGTTCLLLVRLGQDGSGQGDSRLIQVATTGGQQREYAAQASTPIASSWTTVQLSPTANSAVVTAVVGSTRDLFLFRGLLP